MKKRKINALLTAGCLTLLAPSVANATDEWGATYSNVTATDTATVTDTSGATYDSIGVTGTGTTPVTLTINATQGSVNKSATGTGNATLGGYATIELAPALNNTINFSSTNANNQSNVLTQESTGTTQLGITTVSQNSSLTVNANGGSVNSNQTNNSGTLNMNVNGGSANLGTTVLQDNSTTNLSVQSGALAANSVTVKNQASLNMEATAGGITTNRIYVLGGNIVTSGTQHITASGIDVSGTSSIRNTNTAAFLGTISATDSTLTVSGLAGNNYTAMTFTGTNTVNVSNSQIKGVTLAADEVRTYNTSDTVTFTDENITVGAGAQLTIDSSGTTNLATSDVAADNNSHLVLQAGTAADNLTTLNLNTTADGDTVNGKFLQANGNSEINITGLGDVTFSDGVTVAGQNNTIKNTSAKTSNIGYVGFNDDAVADVTLNGNYTISNIYTTADAGATAKTVNLSGTQTATSAHAEAATNLTINQTSGTSTFTGMASEGTLNLNAATDASVEVTNTIGLDNGTLNIDGAGAVTAGGINVATGGALNTVDIKTANDNVSLGNVTMNGNATLALKNVASNNIGSVSIATGATGTNTVNLNNTFVNGVTVGANQTLNVTAGTTASGFADAVVAGTEGNIANLGLASTTANLTGNSLSLGGYSNVTYSDAEGYKTTLSGTPNSVIVSGASNTITNNNTTGKVDLGSNILYADGANTTLNLIGTNGFEVDAVTAGGNDILNADNASLGTVTVSTGDSLAVNTTSGTTDYTNANVSGTLTLNAANAADAINGTATTLNGGTLNTQGAGTLTLNGINASSGANTITNSNTNSNSTLGGLTIGQNTSLAVNAETATKFTTVNFSNLNADGEISSLTLDAQNGNITGGNVSLENGSTIATSNSTGTGNTVTLGDITFNGTNSGITALTGTTLGELDLSADNVEGTVSAAAGATTFNGAKVGTNSELTLGATNGTLAAAPDTGVSVDGGSLSLTGTGAINLNSVSVTNKGGVIANQNTSASLGNVTLNGGNTVLSAVDKTNHSGITLNGNNTITTRSSALGALELAAGQDLTVKTDTANANGAFDSISMAQGAVDNTTDLTLDAAAQTTISGGSTAAAIAMNGNASVTATGAGIVDVSGVTVTGTGNSITNTNTNASTNFGTIALNNAVLNISGLSSTATDGFTFAGAENTINSTNSDLQDFTVGGNQVINISASGTTAIGTATLTGGVDASNNLQNSTLNLAATGAVITADGINMQTANLGVGNDSTSTVNVSGSNLVSLGSVSASGQNNIINSTNDYTDGVMLDGITFAGTDTAIGNSLELNGKFTAGGLTTSGVTDTLKTNGDVLISDFAVGANGDLTVNATGGTMSFTTPATGATIANEGKLTLNANGGDIIADSTGNGVITTSNGSSLIIAGDTKDATTGKSTNSVQLNGVNIVGNTTLTVTNTNEATTLGDLTIGDAEGTTTVLNMGDGVIERVNVGDLTVNDNASWTLDVDSTSRTADSLAVAGDILGSKLNFSINRVLNPTDDKFVSYVKIVDSDSHVLNSTGTSGNRNIMQVLGQTTGAQIYYSYVDASNPAYVADDGDYAANTVRITDYNIASDILLDYVTRQGSREIGIPDTNPYDVSGATTGAGTILALPNLEAREGVDNVLTLNSAKGGSTLDGKGTTQMFTVDTTGDSIERTLNINGLALTNAKSTSASGNGSVIITNSTDTKAEVNLSSKTYTSTDAEGNSEVTTLNPSFTNNVATGNGGVIYNNGAASVINSTAESEVTFSNNVAQANGGAIANVNQATMNFAGTSIFKENISGTNGGAIYNDNAKVSFGTDGKENYFEANVSYGDGGAIANVNNAEVDMRGGSAFVGNATAGDGGAIYNDNATVTMLGENAFLGNYAEGDGGAIASVNNDLDILGVTSYTLNAAGGNGGALSVIDSEVLLDGKQMFVGNTAEGKGGAIYAKGSTASNSAVVNIAATRAGEDTIFTANSAAGESNAIYLDGNATINLSAVDDASIVFNDKLAGTADNNNIIQQSGSVYYNNDNSGYNGDFSLLSGDAYFTEETSKAFEGGNYTLAGGSTLHLKNGVISEINANSIDLSATSVDNPANLTIDLDLSKEISDRFNLTNSSSGNILVSDMNIIGGTGKKQIFYNIAEGAEFDSTQKTVESPYYNYKVSGQTSGLLLTRDKLADTGLMAPQVAVNARLAGQLDMYNQLLHRVDEIAEYRYFNKVNRNNLYASAYETIDNKYTPYVNQEDGGNAWMKPSVTLETIRPDSDGGVEKYKNRAYNTILGYETPVATLRNGWELINTVFGGYQGSFQKYDNIKNWQNGGVGGYMANLYRNNFFAGGVVSAGGIAVNTKDSGKWNRDLDFGLFDVGAAARVGYNVGMGKNWLFQPMFTTSYIYISGISESNDRGEKMELDGTNTLLLSPGFKLVGNYNGWQPYALFDYTWPLIAKTVANVNNIDLPDMKLRSYIEYGVGLRKNFGDKFTGYGEAVFRNVGRTGVSLQGGFVYKF